MEDMEDDVLKEFIIGLLFVQLEGLKNFMEKIVNCISEMQFAIPDDSKKFVTKEVETAYRIVDYNFSQIKADCSQTLQSINAAICALNNSAK